MWIRLLVAGPVFVAAMLQDRPMWQKALIMFAASLGGHFVEHGVRTWRSQWGRAQLTFAAGGALVLGALAGVLAPLMKHAKPTNRFGFVVSPPREEEPPLAAPERRPGTWKQISINNRVACGLRDDATVWCWGDVPIFGDKRAESPRQVPGLANVTAISVGFESTCALADHHAWCFGSNVDGSLGVPRADKNDLRAAPVRVPIKEDLIAVSAGIFHACALTASGAVWCWGMNRAGQIGVAPKPRPGVFRSEDDETRVPTRVAVPAASAIAAGYDVSCAVGRDDGNVRCWGDLDVDGSVDDVEPAAPTVIPGVGAVTAIVAGDEQICVLAEEASPTCWGDRANLDPSRRGPPDPRALYAHEELRGATALAIGHSHACAVLGSGEARCWGADYQGQLGNGQREDVHTHELHGVAVVGIPKLTSVAAGELETCGLTATGEMWCWGHDERK